MNIFHWSTDNMAVWTYISFLWTCPAQGSEILGCWCSGSCRCYDCCYCHQNSTKLNKTQLNFENLKILKIFIEIHSTKLNKTQQNSAKLNKTQLNFENFVRFLSFVELAPPPYLYSIEFMRDNIYAGDIYANWNSGKFEVISVQSSATMNKL